MCCHRELGVSKAIVMDNNSSEPLFSEVSLSQAPRSLRGPRAAHVVSACVQVADFVKDEFVQYHYLKGTGKHESMVVRTSLALEGWLTAGPRRACAPAVRHLQPVCTLSFEGSCLLSSGSWRSAAGVSSCTETTLSGAPCSALPLCTRQHQHADWAAAGRMIFIDSDEYLVVPGNKTLAQILAQYAGKGGLAINWRQASPLTAAAWQLQAPSRPSAAEHTSSAQQVADAARAGGAVRARQTAGGRSQG